MNLILGRNDPVVDIQDFLLYKRISLVNNNH